MEYQRIAYRGESGLYHTLTETGLIPALGGFNLEFTNNDHHISGLTVGWITGVGTGRDFDSYLLGFSDSFDHSIFTDGDPTNLWAKYFPIAAGPSFIVNGSGRGGETITAPTVATGDDDIFILRGFSIRVTGQRDHNLRRLALRHNSARDSISVTFHDDSAEDDGFSFTVLYTIVRRANTSGRRADYYFTGPYSENFDFTNTSLVNKSVPGFSLVTGFDFRFNDNDHHIRKIAIDPISGEQFSVTFTDDERDNPVSGWLEYVNVFE